jgi:hypothetical protein
MLKNNPSARTVRIRALNWNESTLLKKMILMHRLIYVNLVNYQPLKWLALPLDGIGCLIQGWKFTSL